MLLGQGSLLLSEPASFVTLLVAVGAALLVGITVHEFSHAAVAWVLGDATAARLGRLTLNPKAHLDPAGTLLILVVGFGWGRPVPVEPSSLRGGRRGMAVVSLAGPASNLVLAGLFAVPFALGVLSLPSEWPPPGLDLSLLPAYIGVMGVLLNVVLAVFNFLPLAPLDGSAILAGIAPAPLVPMMMQLQRVAPALLFGAILLDIVFGVGIVSRVIGPVVDWAAGTLLGARL